MDNYADEPQRNRSYVDDYEPQQQQQHHHHHHERRYDNDEGGGGGGEQHYNNQDSYNSSRGVVERGHPKFEPRDAPRSSDLNMRDYNDGRDGRMIESMNDHHHHNRADERMGGRFEPVARGGGGEGGSRDYGGRRSPSYKDEYNDNGRRSVVAPPPPSRDERAYERDHHHEDDYNTNNHRGGGGGGYSDGGGRVVREEHHDYPPTRREHSGGYNQGRGGRGGGGGGRGFGRGGRGGRGGDYGGGGRSSGSSRGFIPRGGGSSSSNAGAAPHPSEDPNEPIPQDQRRTLILSNIPHHIKFFHIQEHFNKQTYPGATTGGVNPHGGSGATVQFCIIERGSGEAKVRFKYVEDAMRIWDGGNEGLDGIPDGGRPAHGGGDDSMSFVQLGIRLKAIHFTNFIQDNNPFNSGGTAAAAPPDRGVSVAGGDGGGGFDRKRGYREEDRGGGGGRYDDNNGRGGGGGGGYDDYHPEQRPAKAQRYSEDPRDGGPGSQRRESGPPPSNYRGNQNVGDANLWLGNYGPRTTIEDIKAAFAPYVDVSEVVMKEGFSFVNTQDPEGARKAKEALYGTSMDGMPVKIRIANQRKPKFGGGGDDIEFDRRRDDNGGGFERKRSYGEDRPPPRYEDEPKRREDRPPPRYEDELKRSYREEAPRRYEDDRRGGGYDERDRQYDTPASTSRRPESDYPSSNDTYRRGPPSQQKFTPADRPQSKLPYRGDQNVGDANLHLSNYGPRTTPDDIKAMFAPYVHVTEVVTKNGFSFVNTNDSDGARRAMAALNGALLGGSRCRINSATRKPKLGATPEQQAFVKLESEWRKRRQAEYNTFHAEKVARVKHISKLEQKRDLNVDLEASLNEQFNLHQKMLGVMKTNKADLMEQSKKMKEMLTVQTRLTDLMKETQDIVEEMARLKGEEFEFRPSEKRPVFMGPTGGSGPASGGGAGQPYASPSMKKEAARLDRRTAILKVGGLNGDVSEDALKEHFSTFGAVTSISMENSSGPIEEGQVKSEEGELSLYALVTFANRLDAERAKSSTTAFNDHALTYEWHNPPLAPTPNNDEMMKPEETNGYDSGGAYQDTNEGARHDEFGGDVFNVEAPGGEENGGYGEEGEYVDYD